jgi:tRNA (cmo5U34)-methyltransferase
LNHIGSQKIETERLILRKYSADDAILLYRNWANDPDVFEFTRMLPHQNLDDTREFVERMMSGYGEPDYYRWVVALKERGEPIGVIGLVSVSEFDQACSCGYSIGKPFWSKGYGTEALAALIRFAFIDVGYNRMEAYHSLRNMASGKVMEKAGMTNEGRAQQKYKSTQGFFEDCDIYGIIKDDFLASGHLIEMRDFFNTRAQTYNHYHLMHIGGGMESKDRIAFYLPEDTKSLIDFGIGTGLELKEILKRFPDIAVTGLDTAENMLAILRESYPGQNIELLCMSYFDFDFQEKRYDAAISVMTLHHYTHAVKLSLYRKIFEGICDNGVYIECDYMLSEFEYENPQELEEFYFSEYRRLKAEQRLEDGLEYHYDTPCTVANQIKLLMEAGFKNVREVWRKGNTVTIIAEKGGRLQ